jgi:hypothetical protein
MADWLDRYGYLLFGLIGLVASGWYLLRKARNREPGQSRSVAEKWLDPLNLLARPLSKRERMGWAVAVLLMMVAVVFFPARER